MSDYRLLEVGDPAPDFRQACTSNPSYHFNTVAGRYIVLLTNFFIIKTNSYGL